MVFLTNLREIVSLLGLGKLYFMRPMIFWSFAFVSNTYTVTRHSYFPKINITIWNVVNFKIEKIFVYTFISPLFVDNNVVGMLFYGFQSQKIYSNYYYKKTKLFKFSLYFLTGNLWKYQHWSDSEFFFYDYKETLFSKNKYILHYI